MCGVAIERWTSDRRVGVINWLTATFGPPTPLVWEVDYDYDLESLVMNEEIYLLYLILWPTL